MDPKERVAVISPPQTIIKSGSSGGFWILDRSIVVFFFFCLFEVLLRNFVVIAFFVLNINVQMKLK